MRHLSSKTAQLGWAVVAAFLLVAPSPALAAETPKPAAAVCPATSLLAGLAPLAPLASPAPATPAPFRGSGSILTDGRIAPEGGVWDSELAFRMAAAETVVTFDIGSEATVRSLLVQADANDSYLVEGSMDGVGFVRVGEIPRLDGVHGLRLRALSVAASPLRFLRLSTSSGDGRASISEFQAFCVEADRWEAHLEVVDAPPARAPQSSRRHWNDVSSRWWELALALLGLGLLIYDRRSAKRADLREPQQRAPRKTARRWLFATVGLVSALTYFNFGAFHFGSFVHGWDTFHYYLGAKYFRELSYDRLYDCATVADATREAADSDAIFAARLAHAERRKVRDLRTNELEPTTELLAHPERCTTRFTPDRWREFRQDVAWFRDRESAGRWDEIFADHGFNATPVWNIAGSLLANLGPASDRQIGTLALIDPLYFAGMAAVLVWAFGVPGAAVALLVLATDFPARFFWTGGAYLRWDWLFFTVAAVACLRRGRPYLGGAAFAYAALLRIFPIFLAVGPAAILLAELVRQWRAASGRPLERLRTALASEAVRPSVRFVAGALVAAAVLIPASLVVNGGPPAYRQFFANTIKHQHTPLTNHMGLRTVVSFRPAEVGRELHSESAPEPWERWKEARLAAWGRSRALAAGIALAALLAVALGAIRHRELWIGAALGVAFIPFAVELTSYYYAFLVVPALLWTARREAGIALLLLGAFGLFVSLAPLAGMPTWRDEQYTLISLATLLTLLFVLLRFAFAKPLFQPPSHPV
ncbi:MAG: hypothetical protein KBF21_15345 [Thermoanaerobaculia bacterium]|nr:hypothetical protein [Thermoanaerobaculia bacterium]MBP9825601.1 hypothetical protein [Thermoanaerobaculia bacterium]